MSNLFSITIPDSAAALLVTYGAGALIRVQSSPTTGGSYGDIPNPTVPIVTGQSTYSVYDADGIASDFYKYRYEAADGDPASSYSAAFQPMPQEGLYASLAQFKTFLRAGDDTADDELLLLALGAASRLIDRSTNSAFPLEDETDIPTSITEACLLQASRLVKRRDAPFGVAGSPEFGSELRLLAKLDPDVEMLVANHRSWWSIV